VALFRVVNLHQPSTTTNIKKHFSVNIFFDGGNVCIALLLSTVVIINMPVGKNENAMSTFRFSESQGVNTLLNILYFGFGITIFLLALAENLTQTPATFMFQAPIEIVKYT
jgi:hypothetical protein